MTAQFVTLSLQFFWTLKSFALSDYGWATLALIVVGWFLCSRNGE